MPTSYKQIHSYCMYIYLVDVYKWFMALAAITKSINIPRNNIV